MAAVFEHSLSTPPVEMRADDKESPPVQTSECKPTDGTAPMSDPQDGRNDVQASPKEYPKIDCCSCEPMDFSDGPLQSPTPSSFLPAMEKLLNREETGCEAQNNMTKASPNEREGGDAMESKTMSRLLKENFRLESIRQAQESDLELFHERLQRARRQIEMQSAHSGALQARIRSLEDQVARTPGQLHTQIKVLSKELADARAFIQTRARTEADGLDIAHGRFGSSDLNVAQIALLHDYIAGQQLEIRKWKQEAMGRGSEAVSLNWQASVDEAVGRERAKDAIIIRSLLGEIERLRHESEETA